MDALLSLKIIFIFADRMAKALFPSTILLLIFTWWNRKQFERNSAFWFLVVATSLTFTMRFLYYMMGYSRYSNRYLYTLVVMLIVISVPGLFKIVDIITRKSKWSKQSVMTGVLIVFCLGSLGKGIHHKDEKAFYRHMGQTVKELCGDSPRVLINDNNDYKRLSYYAGTMNGVSCQNCGVAELMTRVKEKTALGRVFVFKRIADAEFRTSFSKAGVSFELKLIETFHDKKKRPYNLYEYTP